MAHGDGAKFAFRRAGAASGAGRAGHMRYLFFLPGNGIEGTDRGAQPARLAQVFVDNSRDGFDIEIALVNKIAAWKQPRWPG